MYSVCPLCMVPIPCRGLKSYDFETFTGTTHCHSCLIWMLRPLSGVLRLSLCMVPIPCRGLKRTLKLLLPIATPADVETPSGVLRLSLLMVPIPCRGLKSYDFETFTGTTHCHSCLIWMLRPLSGVLRLSLVHGPHPLPWA